MLLPSHGTTGDLGTLQQAALDPARTSLTFIRHRADILAGERTEDAHELENGDEPPDRQDVVRVQRDAVGDAPEKGEAHDALFAGDGIQRGRDGEDGVCDEEVVREVQEEGAREVAAGEDGGGRGTGKDFCVSVA